MINVRKAVMNAAVLKLVMQIQYQPATSIAKPDPEIQSHLLNQRYLSEDECYALSNYLEPKEGKEPPARPSILDEFVQLGSSTAMTALTGVFPTLVLYTT